MQKNTPELWDKLWKDTSEQEDRYNLAKEENSIRWQRIEALIKEKFGDFKGLKVIEVGAGGGTNSILFAKKGSNVTILDYSKKAIERSKEFFKRNNCKADFILVDALKLPDKLKRKCDISISFGLAEHFKDEERIKIIKSHFDLLKKGGIAIISVPNKFNFPYQIHKSMFKLMGLWRFGEEYPFSRTEFKKIAKILGIKKIHFIGDSFFASFRYVNPLLILRNKKDTHSIKKQKGNFLDSYLGYSLVFVGS